jgi:amino acid transporter
MTAGQGKLSTFDLTNLVVGSIIGADIYIATAIGSRLIGPASLLVWIAAGAVALTIALSFAYCVMLLPKVGGPYAYVGAAAGPFAGFMAGWALLLAEWFSLSVFPVAFAQYFTALVPGVDQLGQVGLKALFIGIVVAINIIGIKAAGRANDVLTIIKLSPLVLIILGGLVYAALQPAAAASNFVPFLTGGPAEVGQALVLIFWAFAGFELSTLPADMAERPERSIPKAIGIGMLIVTAFYLLTNLAVVASLDQPTLVASSSPLMDAAAVMFSSLGGAASLVVVFIGAAALLSILGADESGMLGTSRLAYAMSLEGHLPHSLARLHPRFKTPYLSIIALGLTAFIASLAGGIPALINSAVLLLGLVYLATYISAMVLLRRDPERSAALRGKRIVPAAGAVLSALLIALISTDVLLIGLALLAVGIPVYTLLSPKKELTEMKEIFLSREERGRWAHHQSERFLALPLHRIETYLNRRKNI